jgi:hypothetical protein
MAYFFLKKLQQTGNTNIDKSIIREKLLTMYSAIFSTIIIMSINLFFASGSFGILNSVIPYINNQLGTLFIDNYKLPDLADTMAIKRISALFMVSLLAFAGVVVVLYTFLMRAISNFENKFNITFVQHKHNDYRQIYPQKNLYAPIIFITIAIIYYLFKFFM